MKTLTIAIAGLALLAAAASAEETVTLDPRSQARAGIEVQPVAERIFGSEIRVVGQVVRSPGSTVPVQTILPGRVELVSAAPGDRVVEGQVLLVLHSHQLLTLQTELLGATSSARLAATRLEAGRQLYELQGISRVELDTREQEELSARLEADSLRSELVDHGYPEGAVAKLLETRQTDAHLPMAAPIDSVVLELHVQTHEWVREYALLMVLGDPDSLELELQLPPAEASNVGAGDSVEFAPVGRPESVGHATVLTRVPQVDPKTRTLRIRAKIEEGFACLFPGAFVDGTLVHGTAFTSPAVPESAVIRAGGRDIVFVRRGPELFAALPVELGALDGSWYQVSSGLEAGDEVVTRGVFLLKSAMLAAREE